MRIVIPGGSGQVGTILARHFHARGDAVAVLSRSPTAAPWRTLAWDARTLGPWTAELEGADIVINLAGRSVNCRYNATNRRDIMRSRVDATRVGGSETGVPDTWRFSIEVARTWEAELERAPTPRTRKIAMRSAMVMSPDPGGILDALAGLVRKGLGGNAGSGAQFVSWIHDRDFVRSIDWLIEHDLSGPVNIAAPNPVTYADFMRVLRRALGVSIGLPASRWMLELGAMLMKTETELILKSRRVVPRRLLESGFRFEFTDWPAAAADLVSRWRQARSGKPPRAPISG